MKILIAQKVEGIAGSEKYLLNLLPALNNSGVAADLLIIYPKNNLVAIEAFEKQMKSAGSFQVLKTPVSSVPTYGQLKAINRIIKEGSYCLIHSNLIATDLIFALVKLFFNRKLILVSGKHGYEENYTNRYGFDPGKRKINFYWACATFAEKFINRSFTISKGLYDLFIGLNITSQKKLELIPYGFDFDEVNETQDSFKGCPQLVIVGRLTAYKGHRYALQALKILAPKYPDIKLLIVGWGELEQELKRMVAQLKIEKHVVFTGFQQNPREIMNASDIVLLPSVSEGFGIVVLEAMATKKPVVAFNVPSPSEIFTHRVTGLLAQPYSVEEYANLIEELIQDPQFGQTLADNAYNKLKEYYNLSRMTKQTINFYQTAVQQ